MHRVGGLEKEDVTGNVSYDPANHQHMTDTRAAKVAKIAQRVPQQDVFGEESGDVLVVSWGGTYGSCHTAVAQLQQQGHKISHIHLRYIFPMPSNIGKLLQSFKKVIVPELNMGQLRMMLRSEFLVDCIGINKVQGKPFSVTELVQQISELMPASSEDAAGENVSGENAKARSKAG